MFIAFRLPSLFTAPAKIGFDLTSVGRDVGWLVGGSYRGIIVGMVVG